MNFRRIILQGTKEQKAQQFYRLITTGETYSGEKEVIFWRRN